MLRIMWNSTQFYAYSNRISWNREVFVLIGGTVIYERVGGLLDHNKFIKLNPLVFLRQKFVLSLKVFIKTLTLKTMSMFTRNRLIIGSILIGTGTLCAYYTSVDQLILMFIYFLTVCMIVYTEFGYRIKEFFSNCINLYKKDKVIFFFLIILSLLFANCFTFGLYSLIGIIDNSYLNLLLPIIKATVVGSILGSNGLSEAILGLKIEEVLSGPKESIVNFDGNNSPNSIGNNHGNVPNTGNNPTPGNNPNSGNSSHALGVGQQSDSLVDSLKRSRPIEREGSLENTSGDEPSYKRNRSLSSSLPRPLHILNTRVPIAPSQALPAASRFSAASLQPVGVSRQLPMPIQSSPHISGALPVPVERLPSLPVLPHKTGLGLPGPVERLPSVSHILANPPLLASEAPGLFPPATILAPINVTIPAPVVPNFPQVIPLQYGGGIPYEHRLNIQGVNSTAPQGLTLPPLDKDLDFIPKNPEDLAALRATIVDKFQKQIQEIPENAIRRSKYGYTPFGSRFSPQAQFSEGERTYILHVVQKQPCDFFVRGEGEHSHIVAGSGLGSRGKRAFANEDLINVFR